MRLCANPCNVCFRVRLLMCTYVWPCALGFKTVRYAFQLYFLLFFVYLLIIIIFSLSLLFSDAVAVCNEGQRINKQLISYKYIKI